VLISASVSDVWFVTQATSPVGVKAMQVGDLYFGWTRAGFPAPPPGAFGGASPAEGPARKPDSTTGSITTDNAADSLRKNRDMAPHAFAL